MKRGHLTLVALCLAIGALTLAGPRTAHADGSSDLRPVLTMLGGLDPQSFDWVAQWARSGAPQVSDPMSNEEQVEAQILSLSRANRQAVLLWLQGSGRSVLYAGGATDDEIGPLRPGVDRAASPSPTPTR